MKQTPRNGNIYIYNNTFHKQIPVEGKKEEVDIAVKQKSLEASLQSCNHPCNILYQ